MVVPTAISSTGFERSLFTPVIYESTRRVLSVRCGEVVFLPGQTCALSELARLALLCANPDLRKFLAQLFSISAVVRCQMKCNRVAGFPSLRDELCGRGVEKPPKGHHCHIHRTRLHESRKARVGDVCVPKVRERFTADRDAVSKIRRVIMPQAKSLNCCGACANLRWRSWFRPQRPHSSPETVWQHRGGFRRGRKHCQRIVTQET